MFVCLFVCLFVCFLFCFCLIIASVSIMSLNCIALVESMFDKNGRKTIYSNTRLYHNPVLQTNGYYIHPLAVMAT